MNPYETPTEPEDNVWTAPRWFALPFRVLGFPLMAVIYLGLKIPLDIVICMDWMFDRVAACCGYDPRYWPLPKGQDVDFRFRRPRCERCNRAVD